MVPHATHGARERTRSSPVKPHLPTFQFPPYTEDYEEEELQDGGFGEDPISREGTPQPLPNGLPPGLHSSERWPLRKEQTPYGRIAAANAASGVAGPSSRHGRQKSLTEAIRTVRTRKASISENAVDFADSLRAPVSY